MAELRAAGVRVCLTTGFAPATRDRILGRPRMDGVDRPRPVAERRRAGAPVARHDPDRRPPPADRRCPRGGGGRRHASDLLAGWRAGAGVVAGVLTGAHGRAELEAAPHTHILSSVADLSGLVLS